MGGGGEDKGGGGTGETWSGVEVRCTSGLEGSGRGRVEMSGFFFRMVNYVVNEVLVEALSNSRAFQRFALRTDKTIQEAAVELAKKRAEAGVKLERHMEEMRENLKRGMDKDKYDGRF